jgi:Bcr/CflA subfamily drug resistance transporter
MIMQYINKTSAANRYFFAALALFILPITGISIDIYTPSLPVVTQYFHVNNAYGQLSITVYMAGLGLMQIFAGGVADSFGRKKPFLFAMIVFIIISFIIPLSSNIHQLLILRFIQGVAVSMIAVPMRSVIPDLFEGKDLYKMVNYMVMAWSIGPIIAPAIGAYLQNYFGWKANFYFLGIYGVVSFLSILFFLPETSQHRHSFNIKSMMMRYQAVIIHSEFYKSVTLAALLYSLLILFAVVSPFIIEATLHYSVIQFGYVALLVGLAWFLGAMANRFYIHIDLAVKEMLCLRLMLVIVSSALIFHTFFALTIFNFVIPMLAIIFLAGILFPNYGARTMALFPTSTGSTNALYGSILFLISAVSGSLGSLLKSSSARPLEMSFLAIIFICYFIYQNKLNMVSKHKADLSEEVAAEAC